MSNHAGGRPWTLTSLLAKRSTPPMRANRLVRGCLRQRALGVAAACGSTQGGAATGPIPGSSDPAGAVMPPSTDSRNALCQIRAQRACIKLEAGRRTIS